MKISEIGGRITFRENDEIYHAATTDSVSYSVNSLKGTRFTYDKNGNMLSSENLYSVKFFDYNAENRMKLSTVTDLTEHTYTATTYAYDGLGRRTLTQTEGHTATRTLYDGTGFEILRQGTVDSNGSFVNYTEAQNRYSPYNPYGGGYYGNRWGYADYFYYLFFGGIWGFGNGGHGSKKGQEEAPEYLTIENMYPLYANGTVAGSYKEDLVYSPHQHYWNSWTNFWGSDTSRHDDYATYKETLYFGTDILGSVRAATDGYARLSGNISYDVFGSPYSRSGTFLNSESLDFGYLGKPYNAATGLYDYGFRDYSPGAARFTTLDPVRDGRNWYAYVLNDPVNFVDITGLASILQRTINDSETNQAYHYAHIIGEKTRLSFVLHGLIDRDELGGFYESNSVWQYSGAKSGFTTNDSGSKTEKYIIRYSGMDDAITEKVVNMVLKTERFGGGDNEQAKSKYSIFKNDCNAFTREVMKEYKKEWKNEYKNNNSESTKREINKAWKKHNKEITADRGKVYNATTGIIENDKKCNGNGK